MNTKILILGVIILLFTLFSGCNEQKKEYSNFVFSIENNTTYEIKANILFKGEGFDYNEEIVVEYGKTNSSSFPIKPVDQLISYEITVYYNE